jgi:hypothetical protein
MSGELTLLAYGSFLLTIMLVWKRVQKIQLTGAANAFFYIAVRCEP